MAVRFPSRPESCFGRTAARVPVETPGRVHFGTLCFRCMSHVTSAGTDRVARRSVRAVRGFEWVRGGEADGECRCAGSVDSGMGSAVGVWYLVTVIFAVVAGCAFTLFLTAVLGSAPRYPRHARWISAGDHDSASPRTWACDLPRPPLTFRQAYRAMDAHGSHDCTRKYAAFEMMMNHVLAENLDRRGIL